jgi:hypothetical protein
MAQDRNEPELWGVVKTLKVVVPVSVVALLVAVTYFIAQDKALKLSAVKGGECVLLGTPTPPDGSVIHLFHQRECAKSHDAEIWAGFHYPAIPAPGQPSPRANCLDTHGATAAQSAYLARFVAALEASGRPLLIFTNNASTTSAREYACVVDVGRRTGSYLAALATSVASGPSGP